jgi:hypothetical protein
MLILRTSIGRFAVGTNGSRKTCELPLSSFLATSNKSKYNLAQQNMTTIHDKLLRREGGKRCPIQCSEEVVFAKRCDMR